MAIDFKILVKINKILTTKNTDLDLNYYPSFHLQHLTYHLRQAMAVGYPLILASLVGEAWLVEEVWITSKRQWPFQEGVAA